MPLDDLNIYILNVFWLVCLNAEVRRSMGPLYLPVQFIWYDWRLLSGLCGKTVFSALLQVNMDAHGKKEVKSVITGQTPSTDEIHVWKLHFPLSFLIFLIISSIIHNFCTYLPADIYPPSHEFSTINPGSYNYDHDLFQQQSQEDRGGKTVSVEGEMRGGWWSGSGIGRWWWWWGGLPRASSRVENLSKLVTATTAGQGAFIQRSTDAAMGSE